MLEKRVAINTSSARGVGHAVLLLGAIHAILNMEESRSEPGDGAASGPQKCSTTSLDDDANGAPVVAAEAVHVVIALEPKGGEDASEAVMEAVEESPSGAGAPTLQEPSVSDLPPPASPVAASSAAAEGTPASSFNELLSSKIKFVKTPLQTKPVPQTVYASNGAQASKAAGKVVFRMDELRQMGKAAVRKESTWPEVLAGQYKECVCFDAESVPSSSPFLPPPSPPSPPPHTRMLSTYPRIKHFS